MNSCPRVAKITDNTNRYKDVVSTNILFILLKKSKTINMIHFHVSAFSLFHLLSLVAQVMCTVFNSSTPTCLHF